MEEKKNIFASLKEKWAAFAKKTEPARNKAGRIIGTTARVFRGIGKWIYRLRGILLAIPVGAAAVLLALRNLRDLPAYVAVTVPKIQENALVLSSELISRGWAVNIPVVVTGGCILMMLLSRRVTYPFLISVFTLVLPIVVRVITILPA